MEIGRTLRNNSMLADQLSSYTMQMVGCQTKVLHNLNQLAVGATHCDRCTSSTNSGAASAALGSGALVLLGLMVSDTIDEERSFLENKWVKAHLALLGKLMLHMEVCKAVAL